MNEDKQNYFKVIEGTTLYYEHYVKYLQKQLEAYENMRKEAIKYCKSNLEIWNIVPIKSNNVKAFIEVHNNYLNILNKVGGSDEKLE